MKLRGVTTRLITTACVALLSAACSAGPTVEEQPAPRSASPAEAAASAGTPPATESLSARCDFDMPGRTFALPGPDDATWLSAAELGSGPDVAIFVHETGHAALCGWLPYAEWAARHGVRALLIDACWYGESVCSEEVRDDVAAWLGAAVTWARAHGGRRVTLVGASMGGAIVTGVGQQLGADSIVNLSSPPVWEDVPPIVKAARSIRVPFLVAGAATDDGIDTGALRKAVGVAPAHVTRYVATPGGHGTSMVTTEALLSHPSETRPTQLGRLLLRWIHGDAS